MKRTFTTLGLALTSLLACCYYGTSEGFSRTSPTARINAGGPAPAETRVYRAPTSFCNQLEEPELPRSTVVDDAPLQVVLSDGRLTLDAQGAFAGRVLSALAGVGDESLFSMGRGAQVRIYAHVEDADRREVMRSVALSAGLVLVERNEVLEAIDPDEAVGRERRERARSICMGPTETRLIPTEHPLEVGRVVSEIMLSCRGRIVASPTRGAVMVTDLAVRVDRIEALILALERQQPGGGFARFQASEERRSSYGVPDHWLPACDLVGDSAPSVPPGTVNAEGHAVGSLLRAVAARSDSNVVVGCGGERAVFFNATPNQALSEVAGVVDLESLNEMTFTSAEIARAARLRRLSTQRERYEYEGRLYSTPFSVDLERVVGSLELAGLVAVALPSNSLLIVTGRVDDLELVTRIVEAWNEPDEPVDDTAPDLDE